MKKKLMSNIIIFLLMIAKVEAQKDIFFSWNFNISDTTIKDKQSIYSGLPWYIHESKNNDVILVSQQFMGWTIENIDKKTGEIIWKNRRNQDFPDNSGKMYLLDNIFERSDGNYEVLGTKTESNYFTPFFEGKPVRSVYHKKDGKEIINIEPKFNYKKEEYPMSWGGASRRFISYENKYLVVSRDEFGLTTPSFTLRTLDTNMVFKDTLLNIYNPFEKSPTMKFQGGSRTMVVGDNIFLVHTFYGGTSDTTLNSVKLFSFSKKGKLNFTKDISKSVYYWVDNRSYSVLKDGFFVLGIIDSSNTKKKVNRNMGLVAKIDTFGNKEWEVLFPHPENKTFQTITAIEDPIRNGYWVSAGHPDDGKPYLYFISKKDKKAKFVARLAIPNNSEKFFPQDTWILKDGSIIYAFRYSKCDNDKNFKYCWGIGKLEKEDLDIFLTAEKTKDNYTSFKLYPNPNSGNLKVQLPNDETGAIKVFSLSGQQLFINTFYQSSNFELALDYLPKGLYIVEVILQDGRKAFEKVIIN